METQKTANRTWTVAIIALAIVVVALFLFFDQHNQLSNVFRSWGVFGILCAVLLMAVICMTPVPSESLLVLLLKIYGVWTGILYSWIGSILSSVIVFWVARHVGKPLLRSMITQERFHKVDEWVRRNGTGGLLIVRLLPLPGSLVSYVVGTIPSVSLWTFVWTAAVTVIPYYLGSALIYLGVSAHLVHWLAIGLAALALFWVLGYYIRKRWVRDLT